MIKNLINAIITTWIYKLSSSYLLNNFFLVFCFRLSVSGIFFDVIDDVEKIHVLRIRNAIYSITIQFLKQMLNL